MWVQLDYLVGVYEILQVRVGNNRFSAEVGDVFASEIYSFFRKVHCFGFDL